MEQILAKPIPMVTAYPMVGKWLMALTHSTVEMLMATQMVMA